MISFVWESALRLQLLFKAKQHLSFVYGLLHLKLLRSIDWVIFDSSGNYDKHIVVKTKNSRVSDSHDYFPKGMSFLAVIKD